MHELLRAGSQHSAESLCNSKQEHVSTEPSNGCLHWEVRELTSFKLAFSKLMCPVMWDFDVFCWRGSTWKRLPNLKLHAKVIQELTLTAYCNSILMAPPTQTPVPVGTTHSVLDRFWVHCAVCVSGGQGEPKEINHRTNGSKSSRAIVGGANIPSLGNAVICGALGQEESKQQSGCRSAQPLSLDDTGVTSCHSH